MGTPLMRKSQTPNQIPEQMQEKSKCDSPVEDALRCFMGTDIDRLVIGSSLLVKEKQDYALKIEYRDRFDLD